MKRITTFVLALLIMPLFAQNSSSPVDWVTYYGDNGTGTLDEAAFATATDAFGNVYLAGRTSSAQNIASGGHQNSFGGGYDAYLVKFNSSGVRLWATYYGGAQWESGYTCTVDANGNVYLAGATGGSAGVISSNGHQNTYGGGNNDAFLVKFDSSGQRLWATYYGGTGDDYANFCTVDNDGNIYMAGATSSTTGIASNGHQNTYGGGSYDPFLVKFDSNGVRQWATYYGGSGSGSIAEIGYSCTTDQSGNVYLVGRTSSSSGIASNGHQNTFGGGYDGFMVKFNSAGVRQWATYYGGPQWESSYSCAVNQNGYIYLAGASGGSAGIIASNGHQNTYGGGNNDAFLAKFDSSGTRLWATYYGGADDDYANSCIVDVAGDVYIAGNTASDSSIAFNGYQNSYGGGALDGFIARFNGSGTLLEATYFGDSLNDRGQSCSIDANGNLYLAGQSSSVNLGTNGHQNTFGGGSYDGYLAKFNVTFTSVQRTENILNVSLFPNPAKDQALIDVKLAGSGDLEVRLYNQLGQVISSEKFYNVQELQHQIQLQSLPSNLYWVEIRTENGNRTMSLIKK